MKLKDVLYLILLAVGLYIAWDYFTREPEVRIVVKKVHDTLPPVIIKEIKWLKGKVDTVFIDSAKSIEGTRVTTVATLDTLLPLTTKRGDSITVKIRDVIWISYQTWDSTFMLDRDLELSATSVRQDTTIERTYYETDWLKTIAIAGAVVLVIEGAKAVLTK